MTRHAAIIGIGSYLPERVMTNADLETMVDTSDEWIVSRTGIEERRIVAEGESTSDLAARAGRIAMERAGVGGRRRRPALRRNDEPRLHHAVDGVHHAGEARTHVPGRRHHGRVHQLHLRACRRVRRPSSPGRANTVLVIGADALTRLVDFTDRSTCVLFGDGAGAVVLGVSRSRASRRSFSAPTAPAPTSSSFLQAERHVPDHRRVGRSARPVREDERLGGLQVRGARDSARDDRGARRLRATRSTTSRGSFRTRPTSASSRRSKSVSASTTSASTPTFISPETRPRRRYLWPWTTCILAGDSRPDDLLALVGFGAGLTWGAAVVRWTMSAPNEEA